MAFQASILTPDGSKFAGEVNDIRLPGALGEFQIKTNHAPLMSSLDVGVIRVRTADGKYLEYAVSGGFVEVNANNLVVLAEAAELSTEINIERAQLARTNAENQLKEAKKKDATTELALKRAVNRLKLAGN